MSETTDTQQPSRLDQLEARLARLEAENAGLRERVAAPPPADHPADAQPKSFNRRQLLAKLGGAGVAGAGLAIAGSALAATPAAAHDTQDLLNGDNTVAPNGVGIRGSINAAILALENDGSGSGLLVQNHSSATAPLVSLSNNGAGPAVNVFSAQAPGVTAVALNKAGVFALTTDDFFANYPTHLAAVVGVAIREDGVAGISQDGGRSGVYAENTAGGFGLYAVSESGIGMSASSHGNDAAFAETFADGHSGVFVKDSSPNGGFGLYAFSGKGIGGYFQGGRAQLKLAPTAGTGPPQSASGAHTKGEIYLDNAGDLYVCTADGTPGTWAKVSYGGASSTAGTIHLLPQPIRIYDTRGNAPFPPAPGKLAPSTSSHYDLKVTAVNVGGVFIPAGATGVIGTLSVTGTVDPGTGNAGYLTTYATGAPPNPATADLTWFGPNETLSVATTSLLDINGKMAIHNGMAGGSSATHVVFDAKGYIT